MTMEHNRATNGEGVVGLEDGAACRRRGAEVEGRRYWLVSQGRSGQAALWSQTVR